MAQSLWISKVIWSRISCHSKLQTCFLLHCVWATLLSLTRVLFHHFLFLFQLLQNVAFVLYTEHQGSLSLLEDHLLSLLLTAVWCSVSYFFPGWSFLCSLYLIAVVYFLLFLLLAFSEKKKLLLLWNLRLWMSKANMENGKVINHQCRDWINSRAL